jgi:hypothetical protein
MILLAKRRDNEAGNGDKPMSIAGLLFDFQRMTSANNNSLSCDREYNAVRGNASMEMSGGIHPPDIAFPENNGNWQSSGQSFSIAAEIADFLP